MVAGVVIASRRLRVIQTESTHRSGLIAILGACFLRRRLPFAHGISGVIRKAVYTRKAAELLPALALRFYWHPEGISFTLFNAMLGSLNGCPSMETPFSCRSSGSAIPARRWPSWSSPSIDTDG